MNSFGFERMYCRTLSHKPFSGELAILDSFDNVIPLFNAQNTPLDTFPLLFGFDLSLNFFISIELTLKLVGTVANKLVKTYQWDLHLNLRCYHSLLGASSSPFECTFWSDWRRERSALWILHPILWSFPQNSSLVDRGYQVLINATANRTSSIENKLIFARLQRVVFPKVKSASA